MTRRLRQAQTDLTEILDLHPQAVQRLRDRRRGAPGSSYGGGGTGNLGSPVEGALGLNGGDPTQDHKHTLTGDDAQQRLDAIDRLEKRIAADTATLLRLCKADAPRRPSPKDQREVERLNDPDPTCEHCTQHRSPGKAEIVHRTGDVAGNLDHPMALCRWCYDTVRRTGRLPNRDGIRRHEQDLKPLRVHA